MGGYYMIERQIVIGLITSTDYLKQIRSEWNDLYIESPMAKRLSSWCWEYFNKYDKAPGRNIEGIYFHKIKTGKIAKNVAEEIEQEILPKLSQEYEAAGLNVEYLLDQTHKYFKERKLLLHSDAIQALITEGSLEEAEVLASDYKPTTDGSRTDLELCSEIILDRIDHAFNHQGEVLIKYRNSLGEFWNDQLVRGGFVALMASEKRGKTFWLLDMAMTACAQGRKVVFFQAGDMTEAQQIKRMCVYLAQKSDNRKYCGEHFEPVMDCIHNQTNNCDKEERCCTTGVFEGRLEEDVKGRIHIDELIEVFESHKKYKPCTECEDYRHTHWGVPWIKKIKEVEPLSAKEARQAAREFFLKSGRSFKLSSHSNGTLTIKHMKALLSVWEKQDGFVPDIIIVDYADILEDPTKEFRHKQNEIWKGLRSMSQEYNCLVVTVTQADAKSYEADRLKLKNFSEDKRKYAHVTAMYGLNQDVGDREKKIGIMRINEIVKREGDFSNTTEITVLQNLRRGRPRLCTYW
jgi:replicative DNA helicase